MSAVQSVPGSWNTIETFYYRYYKSGDAHGFAHGLKYVLGPEAYSRCPSRTTASDATVALYADNYFEYDSSRRVTKSVVNAGLLTYTIAYADNTDTYDYNNWKRKTTIMRPDGALEIVYTNHIGQELLRELRETSSRKWVHYNVYGTDAASKPGLLLEDWMPSAVASYVDNGGSNGKKIVVTATGGGLIRLHDYATSTTATSSTAGDAKGYLKTDQIKNGSGGTPITLRTLKYIKRTVGSNDIFRVAESTVYKNTDGTGAITTKFDYTWQTSPDTFQIKTRTTNLPKIPTSQNGAGDGAGDPQYARRELFDTFGNMTATQDERGFINTVQIDLTTGGTTKIVRDDDSPSGSGWTANSGTRLKLTTDFTLDGLGRATQVLGPAHDIDLGGGTHHSIRTANWSVYDDVNDETRIGQGYYDTVAAAYTLVNPVSITRTDRAGRTTDAISATRGSGATSLGALAASDTFAQSSFVRWSTSIYNNQSQLTAGRQYFLIPASGSGTSGTNYNETIYGYETARMARQNMVRSPGGTITRIVFDVCANATQSWVGTNDAGATDANPAGSGGANNMLQTLANEYDGANAGLDGNLTKTTSMVDANSSNDRATVLGYDWRNRQTVVDGEIDFYLERTFDNLDRVTQIDRKDTTSSGNLVARSQANHDELGRVYQAITVGVDPSSGVIGNSLIDNTWYDPAGKVLKKKPAGSSAWRKLVYDSLGRQTKHCERPAKYS